MGTIQANDDGICFHFFPFCFSIQKSIAVLFFFYSLLQSITHFALHFGNVNKILITSQQNYQEQKLCQREQNEKRRRRSTRFSMPQPCRHTVPLLLHKFAAIRFEKTAPCDERYQASCCRCCLFAFSLNLSRSISSVSMVLLRQYKWKPNRNSVMKFNRTVYRYIP